MDDIVEVGTGEVKVSVGRGILRSFAIGSCVVVAAYDSMHKVGALAHIMLPGSAPDGYAYRTRYAADGIDELIRQMAVEGSKKPDIEVCLVGGANVLKKDDDTICKENGESTTRLLAERQIRVRAAVLGGTERKGVSLNLYCGTVSYMEGDGPEQVLWEAWN